jgi:hypothetical protein
MWKPRRLTTLWAFTACYRDSFTFYSKFESCPFKGSKDKPLCCSLSAKHTLVLRHNCQSWCHKQHLRFSWTRICGNVWTYGWIPTFRRNMLSPYAVLIRKILYLCSQVTRRGTMAQAERGKGASPTRKNMSCMFLRNVGIYSYDYTFSQPRRSQSEYVPPWKLQHIHRWLIWNC